MNEGAPKADDPLTEAILQRIAVKPLDPALHRHLRQEASRVRDELREKFGVSNVAVELIQEVRLNRD